MPKAELHIHLEGAVSPGTVLALARRHGRQHLLPAADEERLRRWFAFRDFNHFVDIYQVIQSLIRTSEDFELVVHQCGRDMSEQNIRYREVTITPFTHTHLQQDKEIAIDDILRGLESGRRRARADYGVEMRWVFDVPRNASFDGEGRYDPSPADVTLEQALAGVEHGVVGLGLGGNEVGAPPHLFAHAFQAAKRAGLASVPHAGETQGPESIWGAIHELQADRIGHGVRAMEDASLLTYLVEHRIPLEVNPHSNVQLGIYPSLEQHPFAHLDQMGVVVTLNSDDPPLFNTSLLDEYRALDRVFGYSPREMARIARNGFEVSVAEPLLKQQLLAEFDAWAATDLPPPETPSAASF